MVQKLRNSTGAFIRSALVLVGWVFFAIAQVTPEPFLKLVFASIARVLPNALACIAAPIQSHLKRVGLGCPLGNPCSPCLIRVLAQGRYFRPVIHHHFQ
jgi:hypothetical protein